MFAELNVSWTILGMQKLHRKSRPSFLDRLLYVFDFAKRTTFGENLDLGSGLIKLFQAGGEA